jgi:uncharacterized membrane protein (DUF106 family)
MKQLLTKLILLLGFSVGLFLYGCTTPRETKSIPNPTPQQILIKTVKATNWLATIGIIGMGLGVFAFFSGNTKFGIAGTIACFVVLSISLAVARYHEMLALYCVIVATVGTVGMFAYTIFVKNKALREIVKSVQELKTTYTEDSKKDVSKILSDNQSKTTQELVTKIKEKL